MSEIDLKGDESAAIRKPLARPQLMAYRSFRKELDETRAFAEMGVKLRAFGVCNTDNALGKPYSDYPPVWLGPGEYDFATLERMVGDLLAASPDAEFLCLLDLNTPRGLARRLRLDSFDAITPAEAMPEWREETRRYLRDLVASSAELHGPSPVLGRMKELLAYWKDLPRWRRLWPVVKIARTLDEFRLACGLSC